MRGRRRRRMEDGGTKSKSVEAVVENNENK